MVLWCDDEVVERLVPDVSKDSNAFIFSIKLHPENSGIKKTTAGISNAK